MFIRTLHAAHRPQAGTGLLRFLAAIALLSLIPAPAPGEEAADAVPFFASQFSAEGYPAPEVPASERVPDDYFQGAVLVGDSLASAFDVHGVVPELTVLTDLGLSARTAAGNKVFQLPGEKHKVTLLEALETMRPRILYLWVGANGLNMKDEARTLADYEQLLDYLLPHYPDTLVYVIAATPIKNKVTHTYENFTNARIVAFNTGLRELAARYRVYYLDFHAVLVNPRGEVDYDYGAGDGIHLRAPAYALLADYLYTHAIPLEENP